MLLGDRCSGSCRASQGGAFWQRVRRGLPFFGVVAVVVWVHVWAVVWRPQWLQDWVGTVVQVPAPVVSARMVVVPPASVTPPAAKPKPQPKTNQPKPPPQPKPKVLKPPVASAPPKSEAVAPTSSPVVPAGASVESSLPGLDVASSAGLESPAGGSVPPDTVPVPEPVSAAGEVDGVGVGADDMAVNLPAHVLFHPSNQAPKGFDPESDSLYGAMALPASVKIDYAVNGRYRSIAYQASGEISWKQDGKTYQARGRLYATLVGERVQTSSGEIGANGLRPVRFGDKARRGEVATHFDYEGNRVNFSTNAPSAVLLPGNQDRLSLFMQLAALVGAQPGYYISGTRFQLATAGTRESGMWEFSVQDSEVLSLPTGAESTIHLLRLPRHEYDTRVELWLAPSLNYLPARIRITQSNGDFAEQNVQAVHPL